MEGRREGRKAREGKGMRRGWREEKVERGGERRGRGFSIKLVEGRGNG